MTSKKKLQFIRDTYEFYFNRSKPFRDTELTEQEKEAFDSIEKDLELLEILKPFVKAIIELKGQNINVLDFNISDSVKEKIMRWLENVD